MSAAEQAVCRTFATLCRMSFEPDNEGADKENEAPDAQMSKEESVRAVLMYTMSESRVCLSMRAPTRGTSCPMPRWAQRQGCRFPETG